MAYCNHSLRTLDLAIMWNHNHILQIKMNKLSITAVNHGCELRLSITAIDYDCQLRLSITAVNHRHQSQPSITAVNQPLIMTVNHSRQSLPSITAVNHSHQSRMSINHWLRLSIKAVVSHGCESQPSIAAVNHSCQSWLQLTGQIWVQSWATNYQRRQNCYNNDYIMIIGALRYSLNGNSSSSCTVKHDGAKE